MNIFQNNNIKQKFNVKVVVIIYIYIERKFKFNIKGILQKVKEPKKKKLLESHHKLAVYVN